MRHYLYWYTSVPVYINVSVVLCLTYLISGMFNLPDRAVELTQRQLLTILLIKSLEIPFSRSHTP